MSSTSYSADTADLVAMNWSASIRVRHPKPDTSVFHPKVGERILPLLAGRAPVISHGGSDLTIGFAVGGTTYAEARVDADEQIKRVLYELELDHPNIVESRLLSNDEVDVEIDALPACVGVGEAALILGVSKQRVAQLAQTDRFPQPVFRLKATPVWRETDVRDFAERRLASRSR